MGCRHHVQPAQAMAATTTIQPLHRFVVHCSSVSGREAALHLQQMQQQHFAQAAVNECHDMSSWDTPTRYPSRPMHTSSPEVSLSGTRSKSGHV